MNEPNSADSNSTVFGRTAVTLTLLDGTTLETFVRKLTLREWEKAVPLLQADNELALTAYMCGEKGHDRAWLNQIHPESYEQLVNVAAEVNLSFFAYAGRKIGRAQALSAQAAALNQLVADSRPPSPNSPRPRG